MSLYANWMALSGKERTQEEYNQFWDEYLPKEKAIYEKIVSNPSIIIQGTLSVIADEFNMTPLVFAGFMDGINSSLLENVNLEDLTDESNIKLEVDLEKLYYNMIAAQADWLYGMPEWDNVLSHEKRSALKKKFNKTKTIVKDKKIGRNEPCPCGSGKKYKHCCIDK